MWKKKTAGKYCNISLGHWHLPLTIQYLVWPGVRLSWLTPDNNTPLLITPSNYVFMAVCYFCLFSPLIDILPLLWIIKFLVALLFFFASEVWELPIFSVNLIKGLFHNNYILSFVHNTLYIYTLFFVQNNIFNNLAHSFSSTDYIYNDFYHNER